MYRSPPLFSSTPVSSASNSGKGTPITNPLVAAGLVLTYLAATFSTPEDDVQIPNGSIPHVHLVTIAIHISMFVPTVCSV